MPHPFSRREDCRKAFKGNTKAKLKRVVQLLPAGVALVFVGSHRAGKHQEYMDDAWEKAMAQVAKRRKLATPEDALDTPFIFVTTLQLENAMIDKELLLQHTLSKKEKTTLDVIRAFKTVFGSAMKWTGHQKHAIQIKGDSV